MMNNLFLRILNNIKIAHRAKKLTLTVKYSKQNLLFLRYLLRHGFINNVVKSNKVLIIFLKYDSFLGVVFSGASISSKGSHQRSKNFLQKAHGNSNLIINLNENTNKYTRLLARFR